MWQQTLNGSIFLPFELMDRSVVCWQDFYSRWWWKMTMFTHIIEFSCVDQNVAGPFNWLKLGLLCFLCSLAGTWISHQETSESWFEMVLYISESVNRSFGRNGCCHRKGLACDVSLRLTRAIMVGKTSLVRVCACLKERQRTSELMSIIFPFLFLAQLSYGGKRQRFFSNAEVKSHKMQIRLSAAVTLDSKMQTL